MKQYKYFYTKQTAAKIRSFYKNVAKKYRHTYSYEDMERNIHDAFFAIYAIERTLRRRKLDKMPTKKGVVIKNGKMVIVK